MAASDPTTDVPTPTGTLQGVAAFSWDGANWQPTGRAGPSVATPTGVLRGVAAFNGGPSWQPAGLAQPGVTTPTGTLDGVAVYTWSGAAWTPPGGTATPSTPHGALRGVAAFNWDGTAWQPASQAGPSVATPYGVLDGVAMFGWSGSAWAAVGAPSLSLDFMSPGTLDPRITFTRASTATYFNSAGVMQTAAANAPRWDYNPNTLALQGLLIEEARTNLALQSSNPTNAAAFTLAATTAVAAAGVAPDGSMTMGRFVETVANSSHGMYMVVTITASTIYSCSLFAKAAEDRYLYLRADDGGANLYAATFDLTAGTITGAIATGGTGTATAAAIQNVGNGIYRCSITGSLGTPTAMRFYPCLSNVGNPGAAFPSYAGNTANGLLVWGAQVEQGGFPTSLIPTAAAAVTRAVDAASIPSANMGFFVSPGGSWSAEFLSFDNGAGNNKRIIGGPTSSVTAMYINSSSNLSQFDGAASESMPSTVTANVVTKGGSTWASGSATLCLNGGAVSQSSSLTTGYAFLASGGIGLLTTVPPAAAGEVVSGYLRRVRYWPRILSNAELQAVTT